MLLKFSSVSVGSKLHYLIPLRHCAVLSDQYITHQANKIGCVEVTIRKHCFPLLHILNFWTAPGSIQITMSHSNELIVRAQLLSD
jgi:hypothetical protein